MAWIVYKTTNVKNGKIYIGVHKTNDENVFDGYLGSGRLLHKAIRKYGRNSFLRETLFVYDSEKSAEEKESELVSEEFVAAGDNYNMTPGGNLPPKNGIAPPTQKGSRWIHKDRENRRISLEAEIPVGWTIGRYFVFSDTELKKRRVRCRERNIENNPMKVPILKAAMMQTSAEQFKNGRTSHNNGEIGKFIWITDGMISKQHKTTESIPTGFMIGRKLNWNTRRKNRAN